MTPLTNYDKTWIMWKHKICMISKFKFSLGQKLFHIFLFFYNFAVAITRIHFTICEMQSNNSNLDTNVAYVIIVFYFVSAKLISCFYVFHILDVKSFYYFITFNVAFKESIFLCNWILDSFCNPWFLFRLSLFFV